jgi:hypothetical protein
MVEILAVCRRWFFRAAPCCVFDSMATAAFRSGRRRLRDVVRGYALARKILPAEMGVARMDRGISGWRRRGSYRRRARLSCSLAVD